MKRRTGPFCGLFVLVGLCLSHCGKVSAGWSADFVIVGSGSAGSVTAGRLAAAGYDVLVLEAGAPTQADLGGCSVPGNCPFISSGRNLTIFDVPMEWLQILLEPQYSDRYEWKFDTDRPGCLPAAARGVGGCGIHNAMIYIRGTPRDFTNDGPWGSMGWTWDRVLDAYKRTENNTDYGSGSNNTYHSDQGPVQISSVQPDAYAKTSGLFMDACSKFTTSNGDFNGGIRDGCGHYQFLIRDGIRDSSAVAFLPPNQRAGGNGTITVRPYSHVSRVLFETNNDGSDPKAVGVEFFDSRENITPIQAFAHKEVVISGGAVNTPVLLLHSGIGEEATLKEAGINVTSDLPAVGRGLMDGVYAIMQFAIPATPEVTDWEHCLPSSSGSQSPFCQQEQAMYEANRSGVFASPGLSSGAFLHSPYSGPDGATDPDIQVTFHPWDKYSRTWNDEQLAAIGPHGTVVSYEMSYNAALSRGSITLSKDNATDPFAAAVFEGPYLLEDSDTDPLVWAIRQMRNITKAFSVPTVELVPGPDVDDDEALRAYLRCGMSQFRPEGMDCDPSPLIVNHLAGTARMAAAPSDGISTRESGVVDGELRVHGVSNLRVADASIFPNLPSGNSHASCMMVGERAAEFLLRTHGRRE